MFLQNIVEPIALALSITSLSTPSFIIKNKVSENLEASSALQTISTL
jgi:hypothetical protein